VQWRADELLAAFARPGALVVFRALASPLPLAPRLQEAGRLELGWGEACTFALAPLPAKLHHHTAAHPAASLRLAIFMQEPNAHRVDIMDFTPGVAADASCEQDDALAPAGIWAKHATLALEGAEDLSLKWSLDGSSLLVLSTTHVDDTNQHYYGTTSLQLMYKGKSSKKKSDGGGDVGSVAQWHSSAIEMDHPGVCVCVCVCMCVCVCVCVCMCAHGS